MHKYIVSKNRLLTPTIREITLDCKEGHDPLLHQPGQYAAISLRDKKRPTTFRCFTIASSPNNQQQLQFSIRVNGHFTSALERLKEGDAIDVRGPYGAFVFNQFNHKDLVMFAGGVGIAPFISMIRYATEMKLDNKLTLVYSSRGQDEIAYLQELNELTKYNVNLKIVHVIGGGSTEKLEGLIVKSGYVNDTVLDSLGLDYGNQTYMMCGPPAYMNAMTKLLKEQGAPKHRILSEAFSLSSGDQTGKLAIWPFNMYAMGGMALLLIGFTVAATDLYKTLPSLKSQTTELSAPVSNTLQQGNDINSRVQTIGPQVDTDVSQDPIVNQTYNSNTNTNAPVQTRPAAPVTSTPVATTPSTPPVRSTVS